MSMQDNIFDVRAALEGKPERILFDEIAEYLGQLEAECMAYRKTWAQMRDGFKAVRRLLDA